MKRSTKIKWAIAAVFGLCTLAFFRSSARVSVRAGSFDDDKRLAAAAVERFHAQYNAGEYQSICNEATPAFRNMGGQRALVAAMAQAKRKRGNVVGAVQAGVHVFSGGEVRFVYNTQFQKGATTEMFVWQSNGHNAFLVGYQVSTGTFEPNSKPRP